MRTKEELDRLRERAIALRREGKSRREIQAILGLVSRSTLNELLRGVPPPDWTRRPNAKDELRDKARKLRAEGLNYNQITARLGVSKSSVSLWVRDLPIPPGLSYEETRRRSAEGARQYWARERKVREARRANERAAAAAEIGELTDQGDPHRRRHRLLVRRREEPSRTASRAGGLHKQRSGADPVLPAFPGHGRHLAKRLDFHRVHPRDRGRNGRPAVLAGGYGGKLRAVQQAIPQTPQPKDHAKERWPGLPRLPADRRPPEQHSPTEDRGLGAAIMAGRGRRWSARTGILVGQQLPERIRTSLSGPKSLVRQAR